MGAGVANTLVAARDAEFHATGVDIPQHPGKRCRQLGSQVHKASVTRPGLPGETFDVVTMWHVREHIPRTIDSLREVCRTLKPGGSTPIVVPSAEHLRARLRRHTCCAFRGMWAGAHYVYHTRHRLRRALADSRLRVLTLPLFNKGVWSHGQLGAFIGSLIFLPRYVLNAMRTACRLSRNLFVIARKHHGWQPSYQTQ